MKKLARLVDADWVLTGPAGGPGDPRNLRFDPAEDRTPQVRLECRILRHVAGTDAPAGRDRDHAQGLLRPLRAGHGPDPAADCRRAPRTTIHAMYRADTPLTVPAQRLLEAFVAEAAAQRNVVPH
ncbi:hypothetical protein ACTMU2_09585 [Cupriavidus basilensis]